MCISLFMSMIQAALHDQALSFFLDDYAPKCAELVSEDDWTQLYELIWMMYPVNEPY